jgi:hypothetical protein
VSDTTQCPVCEGTLPREGLEHDGSTQVHECTNGGTVLLWSETLDEAQPLATGLGPNFKGWPMGPMILTPKRVEVQT